MWWIGIYFFNYINNFIRYTCSWISFFFRIKCYSCVNGELKQKVKNVTLTWEVPNLVKTAKNVKVLHYSTVRNTWEILTPKSVDFDNKTITQEFKDLSPVAVIYQAGDANARPKCCLSQPKSLPSLFF